MGTTNGQAKDQSTAGQAQPNGPQVSTARRTAKRLTSKKLRELLAGLEAPFDGSVIEWRAVQTSRVNGRLRGQVMPYADQRAYTDRLNMLVTPAGWTRRYAVHSTANFHRGKDGQMVAKVFVTCELTVFDLGSHSATGEEWSDDENAGTAAEAQAFKRAASCFGLGRYLYHFTGVWVDLDDRKRPKATPKLPAWATPTGWRQGLRPEPQAPPEQPACGENCDQGKPRIEDDKSIPTQEQADLIRQIESMFQPLGRRLYRGVLKTVARAWQPGDISSIDVLRKVLNQMQAADRLLNRLSTVLQQTGPESLDAILRSLDVRSLEHLESVETLEKIVHALESQ